MVTLGEFFSSNNRPAEMNQEHLSGKTVGQFMTIGSIFQHQGWAHTSVLAVFFSTKNGPTQVYQQHFSGEVVSPFIAIGSIFVHKNGPIQGSW
jgi:hypothetical protein